MAVLLGVSLAGCATTSGQPGQGPDAARGAAGSELVAAQQLIFANRYRAADNAFAALVIHHPRNPAGHAWYSLFLAYRHDLAAALVQAQAAVRSRPASGLAEAVLCRVDDWSNQLELALAAGRRAVALTASEPLGHLFYAEALADHGDLAMARAQLGQATRLVSPGSSAYLRAELAREQANLAHDQGDAAAQLAALATARTAQPRWIERLGELAQGQLRAGQLDAAHATLEAAISTAPLDPGPLEALTVVALTEGDYDTAAALIPRAIALSPDDATLLELRAQVDVAAAHDPRAASRELLAALHRDPSSLGAAAYLLALARYAGIGDAAAARDAIVEARSGTGGLRRSSRPTARPPDPDGHQAEAAAVALGAVNAARATAGLPAVHLEPSLSMSALAHTWYWLFNNAAPTVVGLGIHEEHPGQLGFRGVHPWDRAAAAGHSGTNVGEDITHRGSPTAAVADWVNSVYHRFPILRPDLVTVGYGDATVGPLVMEDMEFGFAPPSAATAPLVFPADGQTHVPAIFVDNELPDPLPAGVPRTTGYPVTVTFAANRSVRVDSFGLRDAAGRPEAVYQIAPSAESENSAALLAQQPLQAGERYRATMVASVDGRSYARSWSFTVASAH